MLPGLALLLVAGEAASEARMIDDHHWEGVGRIVAVGDLHGDYEQYMKVLRDAGLVSSRGRWRGGETHLVQTGDIPDRGPDSRKIIDHLAGLKKQAQRKGGFVHTLIGNHEAMNAYADFRYVHEGEFQAFVGKDSETYRERLWNITLQRLQNLRPETFLDIDINQYRLEWEQRYPLGWVELWIAWQPTGEYGQWVLGNPVAIKLNDTIFLHGGLSAKYCRFTLNELTQQVHAALENFDPQKISILEDPDGPLWYRGLAMDEEDRLGLLVDIMLERYGAGRIVIGHTPTGGIVWPRFDGRVVVNDTGIATYYGGQDAYLELTPGGAMAGYGAAKLPLPSAPEDREGYLRQVIELDPLNATLQRRLARMLAPPEAAVPAEDATPADEAQPPSGGGDEGIGIPGADPAPAANEDQAAAPEPEPVIAPITADTCRPVVSERIQDLQSN